jgi:hypothetical protein
LAVHGEGGVLMSLLGRIWWGYGRLLGSYGKFSSHTRLELGDGSKVRFWHDLWCGYMSLKRAFLGLYGIACARMLLLWLTWNFLVVLFSGT